MRKDRPSDLLDRLASGLRAYVLVALVTALGALPGFFSIPPLDRDESRFAQATAQMLETGDFVRIAVQDDPRNKKPIGIHWLQAASVASFSDVEKREIWAWRLPSLFGAVLAALAAFWGGSVLVGRRAAFVGAALLGVSVLLSTEGMIAKTDAVLCGFTTLTLAALARLRTQGGSGGRLALLAWGALGAGVLIKGPITPMVTGATLVALVLWERRAAWMTPLMKPWGPLLALAITAPWFVAIGIVTDGQFFREALGGDLAPKLSGGGEHPFTPPGVHLLLLPILSFPIVLGLVPGVRLAVRAVRAPADAIEHAGVRFLIAWALPTFLIFEAAPTKLAHYPLPTYPALALLAGAGFVAMFAGDWRRTKWGALALTAFAMIVLTAACAYVATLMPGDAVADHRRAVQTGMIIGAIALTALGALALTRGPARWLAIGVVAALSFTFTLRERLAPEARTILVSHESSAALARTGLHPRFGGASEGFWIVGYREPSLVFETATAAELADGAQAGQMAQTGAALLVESRQAPALDQALAARGLAFASVGPPVVGQNYSNGESVSLQPGRVTSRP